MIGTLTAACQTTTQAAPQVFSVTLPPDETVFLATSVPASVPTLPTRVAAPRMTETEMPIQIPTILTPQDDTATTQTTATPVILTPQATEIVMYIDHYALSRPIARQGVDYVDRTYAYGDTQRGNRPTHSGVEFVNPRGTPVLAAAGGTVFYAGNDAEVMFGPQTNYYGNLVVIAHGIRSPDGQPIYTLYAHLDRVVVETGQSVEQGDRVGIVGDTGVALGPHLHFEVRSGDPYDFSSTLNPELWLYPYPTFGTLAGRVTDAQGNLVYGIAVAITASGSENTRYAFTYADDVVNSSPAWGENFTLGDLPEGEYEVLVSTRNGQVLFRQSVTIVRNRTTWVEIVLP